MVSSIILKVKGIGSTCEVPTAPGVACSPYQVRIWDPADYVIPAQENNALFIQTNQISTRQVRRHHSRPASPLIALAGCTV